MSGMLMTPLLWRLEPVLGVELAGHSGPSDWILAIIFGVVTALLFGIAVVLTRPRTPAAQSDDRRAGARGAATS
jgi:hypothetical protein